MQPQWLHEKRIVSFGISPGFIMFISAASFFRPIFPSLFSPDFLPFSARFYFGVLGVVFSLLLLNAPEIQKKKAA